MNKIIPDGQSFALFLILTDIKKRRSILEKYQHHKTLDAINLQTDMFMGPACEHEESTY